MSAVSSALSAFLFWGLAAQGGIPLLVLFAITFGFFASGYSATWGGVINDIENDAARRNEAVDSGVLYGLLNGARGIGYVAGGLVSVPLIQAGTSERRSEKTGNADNIVDLVEELVVQRIGCSKYFLL
ncbi:unnamed protein product [Alternaria alternata]